MMLIFPVSSSGLISLFLFFIFVCSTRIYGASSQLELAITPPRGWNSYDSYSWIINEAEFLSNAEIVSKRLLQHGYEYVVVDYLWYRRIANGSYTDAYGFDSLDEWGRVVPDPERWPSSRGGKGFREIARRVHALGLKFGIHAMRGISLQAVDQNLPILDVSTGQVYTEGNCLRSAKDVGLKERICAWMPHGFMSVNTETGAGRAFLLSLYRQYADWGVDFVKLDCVFGEDFDGAEIQTVSEILNQLDRPIVLSLSPGKFANPGMANNIKRLVNMYRITADDWDLWNHVEGHFDVARDFAASQLVGIDGLRGKSWPDLDMLPLGYLSDPGANYGPSRQCRLTIDEQRTQMTLWSMAKSPLMFGGDMRQIDESTISIITNPILLEINSFSKNNMEMSASKSSGMRLWVAAGKGGVIYFAIFNLSPTMSSISMKIEDLAKALHMGASIGRSCNATEAWTGTIIPPLGESLSVKVNGHGSAAFVIACSQLIEFG
ncbi:melibiase family protein [Wolffia australiana]